MNIRLSFTLSILLLITKSFSQKVHISFNVKSSTSEEIPFAGLTLLGEKKEYVCNINGKFSGTANGQDSLLVTSVGFVDSVFYVEYLLNNPVAILRRKISVMNEVVIRNGKKQLLGNLKIKQTRSILGGSPSSPSFEIARLINAKDLHGDFKVLKVSFIQKRFCDSMPIMVHIYSVNNDGLPGEDLLMNSPFIVQPEMYKDGIITIDIQDANVVLKKQDFFIGAQFFYPFDATSVKKDVGIGETNKDLTGLTYRRASVFKKRWYAEYTNGFIVPKQNQFSEERYLENSTSVLEPVNLIAEVEIEVFKP
jgi:hypothetical protein